MITIGGGINVHGAINVNGIQIDLSKPLQTCKAILELVDDEDKAEFAREILTELGNPTPGNARSSNPVITQERPVSTFNEVVIASNCNVEYRQSETCKLTIKGKKKDIEKIHTSVIGGTMKITEDKTSYSSKNVTVLLESPLLVKVDNSGTGNFNAIGKVSAIDEELDVSVSTSGGIKFEDAQYDSITADVTSSGDIGFDKCLTNNINASVCGSGDINIKSASICRNASLFVQGSGDVKLYGFAKTIHASVTGSGDVGGRVTCDKLTARVTGSGDIDFKGDIKSHTKKVTGTGRIYIE